ncbi:MAG: hypothetical protein V1814_01420 [Candidatus Moraniibacteriota bacterium]
MNTSISQILRIPEQKFTPLSYRPGVGGASTFSMPSNLKELLVRFEEIASIVMPDGSYNGNSCHAEGYALCLAHEGQPTEANQLFEAIIGNSQEILSTDIFGKYVPVRGRKGTLGYEGLFRYANLCNSSADKDACMAKLLSELIQKVPTECYPIRLQDIRVDSIQILLNLGMEELDGIPSLKEELKRAKKHQY